jgi:hypothetical protein
MAVISLNKFRTIRVGVTTNQVGIYTCPPGVASIVILTQVTNVSSGVALSAYNVTAVHSRTSESPADYRFAKEISVPPNDSVNLIPDGRLALETNDVLKIQSNANNALELILSVLETAKQ